MRKHLAEDFSAIFVLDLGGNVRKNPKLSGSTHNVFGIQVGVCIVILVRDRNPRKGPTQIQYARMPEYMHRGSKYAALEEAQHVKGMVWTALIPNEVHSWLHADEQLDFKDLIPLGIKGVSTNEGPGTIFRIGSLGVATNRDAYVFNHNPRVLETSIRESNRAYGATLMEYKALGRPAKEIERFADVNDKSIKWTRQVKASLANGQIETFTPALVRSSMYRPFTRELLYFSGFWNEEQYKLKKIFPSEATENYAICTVNEAQIDFSAQATSRLISLHFGGRQTKCFPFWTYDEAGSGRRENITDWALTEFCTHYTDQTITKWDIFHATYAVLHHPEYRTRYAANLKRELPRIPFPPDFHTFAGAGKRLMELHIDYEKQAEYPLEQLEDPKAEVTFRVERMKLSKDKTTLRYNDFLTLRGIPPATFDYRLGNRSALEWVIDQYRVSTDPRSGIVNDPNREDDPHYILRLISQVITVSLETQQIIAALPSLGLPSSS